MTTDYDPIANQYQRSKLQPWRAHLEAFTLLETIGEVRGAAVIDIACGEGFYTRLLRQRGAERTLGVDLSPGMIELAQAQEARAPRGIEYQVGDARDLRLDSQFDLAVAAYLLNYASNADELSAMCRSIAACLGPGGRFVSVNMNQARDLRHAPTYRPYGFTTQVVGQEYRAGTPVTWTFYLNDGPFSIENYHLDLATHDAALREAGFREVRWIEPRLSPHSTADGDAEFWAPFVSFPPIAVLECRK